MHPTPITYAKIADPQELGKLFAKGWKLSYKGGLEVTKKIPGHIQLKGYIEEMKKAGENHEANYAETCQRLHLTKEVGEAILISVVNASCPFKPLPGTPKHCETGYMLVTVTRMVSPADTYMLTIQDSDDRYIEYLSKDISKIKAAFEAITKDEVITFDDIFALKIFFD